MFAKSSLCREKAAYNSSEGVGLAEIRRVGPLGDDQPAIRQQPNEILNPTLGHDRVVSPSNEKHWHGKPRELLFDAVGERNLHSLPAAKQTGAQVVVPIYEVLRGSFSRYVADESGYLPEIRARLSVYRGALKYGSV